VLINKLYLKRELPRMNQSCIYKWKIN